MNTRKKKQAEGFSDAEWKKLQDVAQSISNPGENLNSRMFLTIGRSMLLRGGSYRDLKFSGFEICNVEGNIFLAYEEYFSKNKQAGLRDLSVQHRTLRAFQDLENPNFSAPELFQELQKTRPTEAPDALFLQPLTSSDQDGVLFKRMALGKNTLDKFLQKLCMKAELPVRSNHAMRRTEIQSLQRQGVPIDRIMQASGHRSLAGAEADTRDNITLLSEERHSKIIAKRRLSPKLILKDCNASKESLSIC